MSSYQNTKRDVAMFERRRINLLVPTTKKQEIALQKYQATEKRLIEVKDKLMKPTCQVKRLIINQNQFNDKQSEVLYELIRNSATLQSITIKRCRLRNNQLQKICEAIESNRGRTIKEFKIHQLRINQRGAEAIANLLSSKVDLKLLHLVDTGLDCDTLVELCKGIKNCNTLEFLDLRHNIFDSVGLAALIQALSANMSIKHLYLESMPLDLQEAKMLAAFFERDDCMIEELELNEADFDIETLDVIMEAIYKADHLRRLSLAKNPLDFAICQHLSQMPLKLHNFEMLCLSHCNFGDDALETLCAGFHGKNTIKYIDISWNNIEAAGMQYILAMLADNKTLEKLYIQHNMLGEKGAKKMVEALNVHPMMQYLDISANEIGSKGFLYFMELFKNNDPLRNLHVRKNCIKGDEIKDFPPTLRDNTNLFYLDMQDNELDNECAQKLIDLLHDNYFIEDLVIDGNNHINQTNKETIQEECRKNLLIKEYILPHFSVSEQAQNAHQPKAHESHFKNYNVEHLKIENMSFFRSDFIAKFIDMNRQDFKELHLKQVHFDEDIKDLAEFMKTADCKIQSITIDNCDIGQTSLCQIIEDCKEHANMKELHLINMNLSQEDRYKEIVRTLHNHKQLKTLDLKGNGIKDMTDIADLLKHNQNIRNLNLKGNVVQTTQDLDQILLGIANNISITDLKYEIGSDLTNKNKNPDFDSKVLGLIKNQVQINMYIQEKIVPYHNQWQMKGSNSIEYSKTQIRNNIDAAMKYFKCQRSVVKKTRLLFKDCNLTDDALMKITAALLTYENLQLDELDISSNMISDFGTKHVAAILMSTKIKMINLSNNIMIDKDGLKELSKAIRKNNHIEVINLSNCGIDLEGPTGWQSILDDISQNCSLNSFNLDGNIINEQFLTTLKNELEQNKQIQNIVIPSIKDSKDKKAKKEADRQKKRASQRGSRRSTKFLPNNASDGEINNMDDEQFKERKIYSSKKQNKEEQGDNQKKKIFFNFERVRRGSAKRKRSSLIECNDLMQTINDERPGRSTFTHNKTANSETDSISYTSSSNSHNSLEQDFKELDAGLKNQDRQRKKTTLSLKGKNLTQLDFLSKFIRENPEIEDIDLGDNPLTDHELQKFSAGIAKNQQIKTIGMSGIKNLKSGTRTIIQRELIKNEQIELMIKGNNDFKDNSKELLSLQRRSLQSVGFISKFLQGYQDLKILDLTDNRLGNRGAIEITQLIEQTQTIEVLALRNNRIGPTGLQHICSSLTLNKTIKLLDIRDNMIQDESYKMLLAMLLRNETVQTIKYSVTNEENVQRIAKFEQIKDLDNDVIEDQLEHDHLELTTKQKACLPYWCWKSLIHAKHEAFRFKYETVALNTIEDELMDGITIALYVNSAIYYVITFVCPIAFVNACGEGVSLTAHYIYALYTVLTIVMEVLIVLRIQQKINNPNVLQFNKWHGVELFMGLIARFDTYLDVCFLHLLLECESYNLAIPVAILIVCYITYPFWSMWRLWGATKTFEHTLPKIERNCYLAFIRENMLLATVLDSFCIDNSIELCKKAVPFGRTMGIWTLATQDGPQYLIHLLFIFVIHTEVEHAEVTVVMSLIVSSIAIQISIFNCIMCAQNEFDPILLELEMKKRREKASKREAMLEQKKEILKKKIALSDKGNRMAKELAKIGKNSKDLFKNNERMSLFYDKKHFQAEQKLYQMKKTQLGTSNLAVSGVLKQKQKGDDDNVSSNSTVKIVTERDNKVTENSIQSTEGAFDLAEKNAPSALPKSVKSLNGPADLNLIQKPTSNKRFLTKKMSITKPNTGGAGNSGFGGGDMDDMVTPTHVSRQFANKQYSGQEIIIKH